MQSMRPNAYDAIASYLAANSAMSAVICSASDEETDTKYIQTESEKAAEELLSCILYLHGINPPHSNEELYRVACSLAKPLKVPVSVERLFEDPKSNSREEYKMVITNLMYFSRDLFNKFTSILSDIEIQRHVLP